MSDKSIQLLYPPADTTLFETKISTFWFDENGILCALSKKVERTIEHYQEIFDLYKTFIKKGEKLCLLADLYDSMPISKEVRDFMTAEIPNYVKAHAIVSSTSFNSSQTSAFIKFNFLDFPVKLFPTIEEAKQWLKDYF